MPDSRKHRGPHPADPELFAARNETLLREACADLSWLLSRGYADTAALALVGDRYQLRKRQRLAVLRGTCSEEALAGRLSSRLDLAATSGKSLVIDGLNCLITIEAALSGAPLFRGLDGSLRDLASVHGSYRRVEETDAAIELVADALRAAKIDSATWYLDQPVSNSGRLASRLRAYAEANELPWIVEVVMAPDRELARAESVVCSSDSWILDQCQAWIDLPAHSLGDTDVWLVDLSVNRPRGRCP